MAAKSDVKLLGSWAAPFSYKVRIALHLKSVDYEFIEPDLYNKGQLLLESNPIHKRVPVLIHDGKPVCESLVIVQYIDDVWTANGPSFFPSHPYERATARFWAAYVEDKWNPCMTAVYNCAASGGGDEKTIVPLLEEAKQMLAVLENAFIECSKGQEFFGGDRIGYLDIVFGSCLPWMKVNEKMCNVSLIGESSNTPNLFKWAQRLCAHDALKDVFPDTDKLVEFGKSFAAKAAKKG